MSDPSAGGQDAGDAGAGGDQGGILDSGSVASVDQFRATLPEDIRGEGTFQNFKDVGELSRSYHSLVKKMGAGPDNIIVRPGADDDHSAFYTALGRPETAEGYELTDAEGTLADADLKKWFTETVHKAGLNKGQAKAIYDGFNTLMGGRQAETAEQRETQLADKQIEEVAALKTLWGDEFPQKKALAGRAYKTLVPAALQNKLRNPETGAEMWPGLVDDQHMVQFFASLGDFLTEDMSHSGTPGHFGVSIESATAELSAMESDTEQLKILGDKFHPAHAALKERRQRLYNIKSGTAAVEGAPRGT